ncbi:MAG: hypothetical protein EOO20_05110 [Chryseobacterium sp.]|nr:MAG: hypothetical protein EOO20_05110 [Chryseobacterium sp.]
MKNNDLEDFLPHNSDTSLPVNASGTENSPRSARRKNQNSSEQNQGKFGYSQRQSHEKNARLSNIGFMDIPELPYTLPRIVKGRTIIKVPAGSTMEKEVAKQSWYVEFFFHNPAQERMERIRVTRKLNRIKDPRQKLRSFTNLCEAYRIALEGGWNPLDEHANARLKKELIGIDLNEALTLFESYHRAKGTRPKSISTYKSTVNSFIKYHGGNKKVNTISDFEITDFLNFKEREEKWAGVTYNNCRIGLNNGGSNYHGYSANSSPANLPNMQAEVVNYYDNYNITGFPFSAPANYSNKTKGLLTATKVKVLNSPDHFLWTANYYDDEGRVVKTFSQHYLAGSVNASNYDETTNTYSFSGELISSTRLHHTNAGNTKIATRYDYDHLGRKLATFESINDQTEVTLSHLTYDEIGQLKSKKLHNDIHTTNFTYNERGWLKSSTSNEFSLSLGYVDGNNPQWNGNISRQQFTNGTSNTFEYRYDKLNRLLQASAADNLGESISYDLMGNIKSLSRDNFGTNTYHTYSGNKLKGISGFTNSNYDYDANGNLITDSQKNIALAYNSLNLPQSVSGSQNLIYTYDATGRKLAKNSNGNLRRYIDGVEYNSSGVIDIIQTEEGVAQNNNGTYTYLYNLSDHLGNVRYTFDIYNNVVRRLQQDNYYAFGLRKSISPVSSTDNKYLYNGKELQQELGEYDYGARFYDPVIGRWNVVDPLAEKYAALTPYHYGDNNPVNNTDPNGMSVTYNADGSTTYDSNDAVKKFEALQASVGSKKKEEPKTYQGPKLEDINIRADKLGSYGRMGLRSDSGRDPFTFANGDVDYEALRFAETYAAIKKPEDLQWKLIEAAMWLHGGGELAEVGYWGGKALWQGGRALFGRELGELAVEGGGKVFWSGGEVAKNAAMDFAKSNGMKTLEMTTRGRVMNTISPYLPRSISNPIWNSLSRSFAAGARGEANFITTTIGPRPTSIWITVEKPILQKNGVNIITHIR